MNIVLKVAQPQFTNKTFLGPVGRGAWYCSPAFVWKPRPNSKSEESNSWIHLGWFLDASGGCLKQILKLQSLSVLCKMSKGDPKTRWSWGRDVTVFSPQKEQQKTG